MIHPYRSASARSGATLALSGLTAEPNEPQDKGSGVQTQDMLMMEQNKDEQVELSQQSPQTLTQVHLPANLRSSEPAGRPTGSGSSLQKKPLIFTSIQQRAEL